VRRGKQAVSPEDVTIERHGRCLLNLYQGADPATVLDALEADGETLKASRKAVTRRVGPWVVKQSRPGIMALLKHTLHPAHHRRAWVAARFLFEHGVRVPRPRALAEFRRGAAITGHALISDFLEGCRTVEEHAGDLVRREADGDAVAAFLARLADAVVGLNATGAYHTDLSGKNILTREGQAFHFIDLDGVYAPFRQGRRHRLRNLIQLYDSFCDLWGSDVLGPFIHRMLPDGEDGRAWLERVQLGQRTRRARHLRRGPHSNPRCSST